MGKYLSIPIFTLQQLIKTEFLVWQEPNRYLTLNQNPKKELEFYTNNAGIIKTISGYVMIS
ncbi:hypothetical protein DK846_15175 [Methanospirillum lacunae]|uniref:Uncharacterized protein n=1 Tax=Methanospirillum lacunae TaxID=668570 RepID=A0A2V2MVK2_9EURY|nr:hypothetical protein DK846_15175 [Methanospirillum lacunae]